MSKLCTYIEVKDFTEVGILVRANLPHNERSLIARLLCGILPLEVEKGRFKKNRKEKDVRYCRTCNTTKVEDEIHMIFHCEALLTTRESKLDPLLGKESGVKDYEDHDKLKWLLSKDHIKEFSKVFACLFQQRRDSLYKAN